MKKNLWKIFINLFVIKLVMLGTRFLRTVIIIITMRPNRILSNMQTGFEESYITDVINFIR